MENIKDGNIMCLIYASENKNKSKMDIIQEKQNFDTFINMLVKAVAKYGDEVLKELETVA